MVQHVYERASMARYLDSVLVATDDERIASAVRRFGGRVQITASDHPTGTDRLAEIATTESAALFVNIQGDEPLIDPEAIDAGILAVQHNDDEIAMATLKKPISDPADIRNPNVVKVVTDRAGNAIYFSRSPIPFDRDGAPAAKYFKHVGLYVYRRDFLLQYPDLPVGPLERSERLEQLRALENGYRIKVAEANYESIGVDTPEDLKRVERLFTMESTLGGACLSTSS